MRVPNYHINTNAIANMAKRAEEKRRFDASNAPQAGEVGRSVADRQADLTKRSLIGAEKFQENLPQYINQEASQLRRGLSQKLADTQNQIRGGANSRGMLFSGRRMADEGRAQQAIGAEYASGLGGIVSGANEQALGMAADPLSSMANIGEATNATNSYLARANEARQAATDSLRNQYIGMAGGGIGKYLGDRPGLDKNNG